jgi:polar amino acid transport system substrate-binding protein
MRQRYWIFTLIVLIAWHLWGAAIPSGRAAELPPLNIMTESWEPYNFEKDGKLQGIAVDLLVLMLEKAGSRQNRDDIQLMVWSRGYGLVQSDPTGLLFSTTMTKEREKLFKWVGPIDENTTEMIARKDRQIRINSTDELKDYKIGVVINDVGEQLLLTKGVAKDKMQRVVNREQVQHLLHTGRVDLSPDNYQGFRSFCKAAGYNPDDYESVFILNKDVISYAFHPDTPDTVIQALQKALDALKADGTYDRILTQYK